MSKRFVKAAGLVDRKAFYPLERAVALLQELPPAKFNETVGLSVSLTIDPKKTEQMVRGTVMLPHGTGKPRRVVVFCKGEKESQAREAGADFVGAADLIAKVEGGWLEFDVAVATPDMMRDVSKLGKLLGPRGLMPSPKAGTVSEDVVKAVTEVKRGKIEFKMDKQANLHVVVGKRSFSPPQLLENARAALDAVVRAKPATVKGKMVKRVTLSSTMSPGIAINTDALEVSVG